MKTYDKPSESKSENFNLSTDAQDLKSALHIPGGKVTAAIEAETGKMPWVSWLGLSVISMVASATLVATKKQERDFASFVGLWAPCFMLMGVYNKLVQIEKRIVMPVPHADVPGSTAYLS